MSYLNPLDPTFEMRRLEIEKSIMILEERLLKRKELDLQIEKEILEQQESTKKSNKYETAYHISERGYGIEKQLDERLGYLQTFDPRAGLIKALEQEKIETDYLTRLRELEIQQNIIDRECLRKREDVLYYNNNSMGYADNLYPLDVSGEVLARKYVDGTRALELNEELKKSSGNLRKITDQNVIMNKKELINEDRHRLLSHRKEPDHSTVKKYVISSKKNNNENDYISKNHSHNNNSVAPTPIKMIENSSSGFNSTAGNFYNNEENKNLTQIEEQESLQESPILEPKGLKKSRSKSTQPTNQYIVTSYLEPKSFEATQRPKSGQKNSRYLPNRQKSAKSLRYASGTNKPESENYEPMEKKIRREVQDRLRMSERSKETLDIFYAKDITEYLITIYGKEDKFRKELKEKVCKIPVVERKFDVCPVLE